MPNTSNLGSTAENGLHFLYDRVLNWVRKGELNQPSVQPTPIPRETKTSARRKAMAHGSSIESIVEEVDKENDVRLLYYTFLFCNFIIWCAFLFSVLTFKAPMTFAAHFIFIFVLFFNDTKFAGRFKGLPCSSSVFLFIYLFTASFSSFRGIIKSKPNLRKVYTWCKIDTDTGEVLLSKLYLPPFGKEVYSSRPLFRRGLVYCKAICDYLVKIADSLPILSSPHAYPIILRSTLSGLIFRKLFFAVNVLYARINDSQYVHVDVISLLLSCKMGFRDSDQTPRYMASNLLYTVCSDSSVQIR